MSELTQVTQSEYFRAIKESTEELIVFYSDVENSSIHKQDYAYEYQKHSEDRYRLDGTIFSSYRVMHQAKRTETEDRAVTRWPFEVVSTIYYLSKYYEPFEDSKKMPHDEFREICGGS